MRTEEDFAKGFNCGYDCSMQVLADLAPEVGLTEEQGLKLGACVGVGAGQGSFCGAVTAAPFNAKGFAPTVTTRVCAKTADAVKRANNRNIVFFIVSVLFCIDCLISPNRCPRADL